MKHRIDVQRVRDSSSLSSTKNKILKHGKIPDV